jgi:hypothetical protein
LYTIPEGLPVDLMTIVPQSDPDTSLPQIAPSPEAATGRSQNATVHELPTSSEGDTATVAWPPDAKSIEWHASMAQTALHPSPLTIFPSSHVSPLPTMPSPQRTEHTPLVQLWPLAQAVAT